MTFVVLSAMIVVLSSSVFVYAWHDCPNGGICPDGNKCCPTAVPGMSTCISGKTETSGDCCLNESGEIDGLTGCGEGFACVTTTNTTMANFTSYFNNGNRSNYDSSLKLPERNYGCEKIDPSDDTLPDRLPRYHLCWVPESVLKNVYGLRVLQYSDHNDRRTDESSLYDVSTLASNSSSSVMDDQTPLPELAYLSTMGALDDVNATIYDLHKKVQTVVIVIHGSRRNIDDYICCTNMALPVSDQNPENNNSTIMIIAPWFLSPDDNFTGFSNHNNDMLSNLYSANNNSNDQRIPLRWGESGPYDHTWRYGADAINAKNFSSYAATDAILDRLINDSVRFPVLKRIVVIGHSAGGQYTHRWALLSKSAAFSFFQQQRQRNRRRRRRHIDWSPLPNSRKNTRIIKMRVVVANPRSYCYLDTRRYNVNGSFIVPSTDDISKCPTYNEWEWGLGNGTYLPIPYKDQAIMKAGGIRKLIARYGTREVVYLSGEQDVLYNGDCEEKFQGQNRRERSERYMKALEEHIYQDSTKFIDIINHKTKNNFLHKRFVVPGVNHDQCLMFQSPQGKQALFGWLSREKILNEFSFFANKGH